MATTEDSSVTGASANTSHTESCTCDARQCTWDHVRRQPQLVQGVAGCPQIATHVVFGEARHVNHIWEIGVYDGGVGQPVGKAAGR